MKKARKIFLWVGLIIVAITVIACIALSVMDYISEYRRSIEDPDLYKGGDVGYWSAVNFFALLMPPIVVELIFIRNGCVFLTPEAPKERKIRCMVSTVLAMLVVTIGVLIVFEFVHFEYEVQSNIILSLLPTTILSLALGKRTRAKREEPIQ